jgi:hypothetical protein
MADSSVDPPAALPYFAGSSEQSQQSQFNVSVACLEQLQEIGKRLGELVEFNKRSEIRRQAM